MKSFSLTTILSLSLILSTPTISLAHVGHGDEFQATGGIERVKVNPETDGLLGIEVNKIAQASGDGVGVMIPITALVDADGKQLVFVKYGDFYEPVEVTTGVSEGDFIQVTKELSVGENLVTQGSLSLYAESRKTQSADTSTTESSEKTSQSGENTSEPVETSTNQSIVTNSNDSTSTTSPDSISNNSNSLDNQTTSEKESPLLKILLMVGGLAILLGGIGAFVMTQGNSNKPKRN